MTDDPDRDLVQAIAQGEAAAMRAMVARKLPRLLALATRMLGDPGEAEDVAQETFLRIWRHAGRWRQGQARFDTWVHRVALNLCYDRLRRPREHPTDALPAMPDEGPLPDAVLTEAESDARRVEHALGRLPARQREAIVLVYFQDMSNREAAAAMRVSVDALESLLSRGRRSLQACLRDEDDESSREIADG